MKTMLVFCSIFSSAVTTILVILHYCSIWFMRFENYAYQTGYGYSVSAIGYVANKLGREVTVPVLEFDLDTKEDLLLYATDCAVKEGINPSIFRANLKQESSYSPDVKSHKGAIGLGQLMPKTAKDECGLSVHEAWEPKKNIACSAKYLAKLIKTYNDNIVYALQHYNGGKGCINVCDESIQHSDKVLKFAARDIT